MIVESCSDEDDDLNTSTGSGAGAAASAGDEHFQQLRQKHEQLKKRVEEKQRHDENVESVLQK